MENIVVSIMNSYGYMGIFMLIMLENLFPPIPSELILSFGGFMTTITDMEVSGVVISATLGSFCGGELLYFIGTLFDTEKLVSLAENGYGRILHIKAEDIRKAQQWFCTKGEKNGFFLPLYSCFAQPYQYSCRYGRDECAAFCGVHSGRQCNMEHNTYICGYFGGNKAGSYTADY